MAGQSVRISEKSLQTLRELAAQSGESMKTIIGQAVEQYRRKRILEEGNAAYSRLREDPVAMAEWHKELEGWDTTLVED